MAHNIDFSNDRANVAFIGSRKDVWHHLGQEMLPGQSIEQWAKAAGFEWSADKSPAYFNRNGEFVRVEGFSHLTRSDTGAELGYVADNYYNTVQPIDVLRWFERYVSVDDRFQLDCAGSLRGGQRIWATATFNGPITVAGSEHKAHLLMTTGFDGKFATRNQGSLTRSVCENTVMASLADTRAQVTTSHQTKFDAKQVANELATLAKGFEVYKQMGDALATVEFVDSDVARFFKNLLKIDRDAQREDISTRKFNQFLELRDAYTATVDEGTEDGTAWTAFNAVTRYVDHTRSTQNTEGDENLSRLASANFGSGDKLKTTAWNLLMPLIKDRVAA
jgi:phage/plasmid-like protein (TIGR03299 family)